MKLAMADECTPLLVRALDHYAAYLKPTKRWDVALAEELKRKQPRAQGAGRRSQLSPGADKIARVLARDNLRAPTLAPYAMRKVSYAIYAPRFSDRFAAVPGACDYIVPGCPWLRSLNVQTFESG